MISKFLAEHDACQDAQAWAKGKSWKEIYDTCDMGGWLLWLFYRTDDGSHVRQLTLAKALCLNVIRCYLYNDQQRVLLDEAISYGKGDISENMLREVIKVTYPDITSSKFMEDKALCSVILNTECAELCVHHASNIEGWHAVQRYKNSLFSTTATSFMDYSTATSGSCTFSEGVAKAIYTAAQLDYKKKIITVVREALPYEIWTIKDEEPSE